MTMRRIEEQLADPITKHMRSDLTRLSSGQTVGEALARIRAQPQSGRIIYFYVVDEAERLVGVLPTRRLLQSPLGQPITEIMVRQVVTIPSTATVLDACEFFTMHRFLAFPVVDEERRLLGVVDVELYTDELGELSEGSKTDDLFQLIGVHITQAEQTAPLVSFRNRFPWLLCNIAGGILAALLAGLYEEELERTVALSLFIPVVLTLAEAVGIQSLSLTLQVLHGGRPSWRTLFKRVRAELMTGVLLGGASALVVAAIALLWIGQGRLALCLLGGITGGVAGAAVLGFSVPALLRLVRLDPRVAAGPIALAASDMLTLLAYFNLARWLIP
jgi:magnesium transporter